MIKECGFYTFAQSLSKDNIGSSRIRAKWLCNYWPEAEIFVMGQEYKTVVFQKVYWPEYATLFKGTKILDICDIKDEDWDLGAKKMIHFCDGITTSTETMAKFIRTITNKPVICIPDRLDFYYFKEEKKEHHGKAKIVAWQGYNSNFPMLAWAIPALIKNKISKLIIISDNKYNLPLPKEATKNLEIINILWEEETINKNLLLADIIINPHYNKGKWHYKSNNKTITAWALGLPVAHTEKELGSLINEDSRKLESEKRHREVREKYDVKLSVMELKNFINRLNSKTNIKYKEEPKSDFIPNWSKKTKELKKYLKLVEKINKRYGLDYRIGRIGRKIKKISPNAYNFLKAFTGKKFFLLYLELLIGKIGIFINNKNPKLYLLIKEKISKVK